MGDAKHLWVQFSPEEGDNREVIISRDEHNDVRVCDGQHVVKIRFTKDNKLRDILVNDIFVHKEGI